MKKKKIKKSSILIYFLLSLLVIIYIVPLLWVVISSFKTNGELFASPFGFAKVLQWDNYAVAWNRAHLGIATLNSVFVCVLALFFSLLFGAMAAFALGRLRWRWSDSIMVYFMLGMMIPIHCVLIPLFKKFADLGLTDSLLGLVIPYVTFGLPMTIFILTGFFKGMPGDIFESACIDGCSIYSCFIKIALPLAKTGLFVTGLMTFVANWNELLMAMVFISDVNKKTLPVSLRAFVGPYAVNYTQMFAAIIISILPAILVYCAFSNQIVEGLTQGAVKG